MNDRERRLAIIVGVFGAAFVLWLGFNTLFMKPIEEARTKRENYSKTYNDLKKLEERTKKLVKEWKADAERTFSFDDTLAKDKLGFELKRIANENGFDAPNVRPAAGIRIGYKSQIKSVANQVSIVGDYAKTLAFLRGIYQSPFLCQVTGVSISPLGARYGRNMVRLDVVVETPVLPKSFKGVDMGDPPPSTMAQNPDKELPPFRDDLAPESYYALLEDRNILREFLAPPDTTVMIDNQDRKMVGIKAEFLWDGKIETQSTQGVEGKKQVQISGRGDIAKLTVAYADGHTVGPIEHPFGTQSTWAYSVPPRTPDDPPQYIELAVNNTNAEEILVNIVVTTEDDKQLTPPTMLIEANRLVDIGQWRAKQIQVSARYRSNKPAPGGTYMPVGSKQTLIIPPEPAEPVYADVGEPPAVDPEPDGRYTVSGLWTYRDVQEMIVTSAEGRKVITAGEPEAVDGGKLLAVHPLGGVVRMATGNYYLYPLGKPFTERYKLEGVTEEDQLAEAIDAWARQ